MALLCRHRGSHPERTFEDDDERIVKSRASFVCAHGVWRVVLDSVAFCCGETREFFSCPIEPDVLRCSCLSPPLKSIPSYSPNTINQNHHYHQYKSTSFSIRRTACLASRVSCVACKHDDG